MPKHYHPWNVIVGEQSKAEPLEKGFLSLRALVVSVRKKGGLKDSQRLHVAIQHILRAQRVLI